MAAPNYPPLPRGTGPAPEIAPLATSSWFPMAELADLARRGGDFAHKAGRLWLGRTPTGDELPIGWMDDRHMVTIAGSRAGKGVSAIIPVLCDYPGSVICLDPKGENAYRTSARRGFGASAITGLHQAVYVLDPYGISGVEEIYRATFDPLSGLNPDSDDALEEATLIAEALVISSNPRDAHWDDSARALVEAVILHVVSWDSYEGDRTLGRVRQLIRDGDPNELQRFQEYCDEENEREGLQQQSVEMTAFDVLLELMSGNEAFDGVIAGVASGLKDLGERERGSILSTARRNLKFLDAPRMQASLAPGSHNLRLEDLRSSKAGVTVYIVLPSRLMSTHARWMRLVLNLTVSRLEQEATRSRDGKPILAVLDEFPVLGHLSVMETAIGYMAGFGLKIWAILQDISQLKRHYPESWESFLGNAGLLQVFGNVDHSTLDYITKRLGELEVSRESTSFTESRSTTVRDLSDFEKARHSKEKLLGSLDFQNDTRSHDTTSSETEGTSLAVQKTQLLTPDEARQIFSRASGLQAILLSDYRPIILRRSRYFEDPYFQDKYQKDEQSLIPGPGSSSKTKMLSSGNR